MNRYGLLCRSILEAPSCSQRDMADLLGVSLGTVNGLVKECLEQGLIVERMEEACSTANSAVDVQRPGNETLVAQTTGNPLPHPGRYALTAKGLEFMDQFRVDGALVIAAGFGSRFVPLTYEMPKGLLEVYGERMIERQIKQLHEVGVTDITIVVGYLKEKFEYLMDKYDVKLLYNAEYSCKNTLATIHKARKVLEGKNMYILSSDNWMRNNMYHTYECGAWYSSGYMEGETSEWCLSFNKKGRITDVTVGGRDSWVMYGPVYMTKAFSSEFLPVLDAYYERPGTEQFYWEQVLLDLVNKQGIAVESSVPKVSEDFAMYINRQPAEQVYEFENLEELRQFDERYINHSDNKAMELVAEVFDIPESEITGIRCLKAGMTNKSWLFQVRRKHYICRIPGPGTEMLINRKQEAAVYEAVSGLGITEHIIYFNGNTGYKISEYYEGARNSDPENWDDVARCMELLHKLHDSRLEVEHSFDMRERIEFYEKLCLNHGGIPFEDYDVVREHMGQLMAQLESMTDRPQVLSHIDSVADNFLFIPAGDGAETVRLIDWEYAGMCDPLFDLSMCAIYSYYDDAQVEKLIQIYLGREADDEERYVIYAYIALGGFLWSLWAIYKSALGEEFGEYTITMYRYAKRYYKKLM